MKLVYGPSERPTWSFMLGVLAGCSQAANSGPTWIPKGTIAVLYYEDRGWGEDHDPLKEPW